ncbi:MAG: alpha/beta fold hydrolase [Solirubrobacteraceae bacterium]|nr:alpha/beta fold hydrolase [Solirubrobacteraceae bacterium]
MPAPLVLLHGFTQTGQSWSPVCEHLELDPPRDLIAPDQRGHGAAGDVRPILLPAMAADAMAQRPAGGELALAGYSMGGRAALLAAVASPGRVTHLALISTTAGIEDVDERARRAASDESFATRIEELTIEEVVDGWSSQPLFADQDPAVAAFAREDRLRNEPANLAASLRGAGTGRMGDLWGSLGGLTMPTLVMAGERDTKYVAIAERLAAALPDAELAIVPGAGHQLPLEAPEAVARALERLLAR